jgi:hypothetical protein
VLFDKFREPTPIQFVCLPSISRLPGKHAFAHIEHSKLLAIEGNLEFDVGIPKLAIRNIERYLKPHSFLRLGELHR